MNQAFPQYLLHDSSLAGRLKPSEKWFLTIIIILGSEVGRGQREGVRLEEGGGSMGGE